MSKETVEVVYGKHRIYHVIRDGGLFGTSYYVRSTDGKVFASFSRLDEAVHWARRKAAEF